VKMRGQIIKYLYVGILVATLLPPLVCQAAGPKAPVPKTGQTISILPGDDGTLQKGTAWPVPRFTDNGDGSIRDNLTGLVWLKNANCFGKLNWAAALAAANALTNGQCGLTDGSIAGDWHLPNRRELMSLLDIQYESPALSNASGTGKWQEGNIFTGVQLDRYSVSTTTGLYTWSVTFKDGTSQVAGQSNLLYVWPVRDGTAP